MTPGTKEKSVEQDHSYAKKKLEFLAVHAEASFMPTTIVKDEDSSDDEYVPIAILILQTRTVYLMRMMMIQMMKIQ